MYMCVSAVVQEVGKLRVLCQYPADLWAALKPPPAGERKSHEERVQEEVLRQMNPAFVGNRPAPAGPERARLLALERGGGDVVAGVPAPPPPALPAGAFGFAVAAPVPPAAAAAAAAVPPFAAAGVAEEKKAAPLDQMSACVRVVVRVCA